MSAPAGNKFWEARVSHGRNAAFATPEDMWTSCCEFFEWADANPLKGEKLFSYEGSIIRGEFSKMRAMTIEGLCNFLGITSRTWRAYRVKNDFVPIIERVEQVLFEQKFTGAAADLLNPNIIARDLGLVEKQEHFGKDGAALIPEDPSTRDLAKAVLALLGKGVREEGNNGEPA